jgi:hypothetical protein
MAASTKAFFLYPPSPGLGGAGHVEPPGGAMLPEGSPAWLWGQGTPAAIAPFTTVNKGSIYSEVNATDDDPNLWMKVDEGGDAADWVRMGSTGVFVVRGLLVDISAADSEQIPFHAVTACEILEAGLVWQEATGTTGAADGDVTVGSATGGAQFVVADAYDISKASGSYQALTLVTGAMAAGTSVFWSHDQAASAAGTYYPQLKIRVEA